MINFKEVLAYTYYGGGILLIFFLLLYLKPDILGHLRESKIERAEINTPTHLVRRTQLDRIKNALEIHFLEKGRYPQRLEELISAKLIRRQDLFYRKGVSYQYDLKDGRYFLKH